MALLNNGTSLIGKMILAPSYSVFAPSMQDAIRKLLHTVHSVSHGAPNIFRIVVKILVVAPVYWSLFQKDPRN